MKTRDIKTADSSKNRRKLLKSNMLKAVTGSITLNPPRNVRLQEYLVSAKNTAFAEASKEKSVEMAVDKDLEESHKTITAESARMATPDQSSEREAISQR